MILAPVCLFTYNRLSETKQTVEALKNNYLASTSELFIFSDGPKDDASAKKVNEVREYLKTINGFKSITIYESTTNKGLANSIISGVTKIIEKHGKVIVLEDDLITSPNFLNFNNQALDFYKKNDKIFSISGYTMDLPSFKNEKKDFYYGYRASSWGWATWLDRWQEVDWEIKDYASFVKSKSSKSKFSRGGVDLPRMLKNQMTGKIDSWAIRWCYNQFKRDQFTVFPTKSKLISIGFGDNATHTKTTKRFDTKLVTTNQVNFNFEDDIILNKKLVKEHKFKFSLIMRLLDRLI